MSCPKKLVSSIFLKIVDSAQSWRVPEIYQYVFSWPLYPLRTGCRPFDSFHFCWCTLKKLVVLPLFLQWLQLTHKRRKTQTFHHCRYSQRGFYTQDRSRDKGILLCPRWSVGLSLRYWSKDFHTSQTGPYSSKPLDLEQRGISITILGFNDQTKNLPLCHSKARYSWQSWQDSAWHRW